MTIALEGASNNNGKLYVRPKVYQDHNNCFSYPQVLNNVEPNLDSSQRQLMDTLVTCNLKNILPEAEVQKFGGGISQFCL